MQGQAWLLDCIKFMFSVLQNSSWALNAKNLNINLSSMNLWPWRCGLISSYLLLLCKVLNTFPQFSLEDSYVDNTWNNQKIKGTQSRCWSILLMLTTSTLWRSVLQFWNIFHGGNVQKGEMKSQVILHGNENEIQIFLLKC